MNDKAEHYEISADLPGVDKKDIHVTVDGDLLTIEATTAEENERVIRKERRSGKYVRSLPLRADQMKLI
ncbi:MULTISPECIES: Hsp20/alpha crystallin family protein [unclassified Shewanella]|uniref:Hsp20/alpha crystallin family protein n=1 Tax=unclassified Shewanella TaxID=196818 RepID=UPI00137B9CE9|nr:Hsp20/alpha crystallin family protein [Shewanella sp. SR44-4]QHS15548.1 Hsp20/alpha crystallin family protein [Shewanella sp. Arc9-LZ]